MIRNLAFFCVFLLSGCSNVEEDLDAYFHDVKKRPAGKIEEIPEYPPYESFSYQAVNKRAPFERPQLQIDQVIDFTPSAQPIVNRALMPLEAFNVEELKLVGSLFGDGVNWGLIKDPGGMVHRVKVGDYLGKSYGRITIIDSDYLSFIELIPAGEDLWRERPRSLLLNSGADK